MPSPPNTMPQWKLDRINPTPFMRPGRSEYAAFHENWEARMQANKSLVNVWLSTDPECEWTPWRVYGQHCEPKQAVVRVKKHLEVHIRPMLQPGCYTIECGEHRATLEVESDA